MATNFKNEIGNRYGNLVVIGKSEKRTSRGAAYWKCKCDCGNVKDMCGTTLRNGQSKTCGCVDGGSPSTNQVYRRLWKSLRNGAKSRNHKWEIKYDDFKKIVHENCYLCGSEPYEKRYGYNRKRYKLGIERDVSVIMNSIDRIDNDKGYVYGNVASCCTSCNRMKSDFDKKVFLEQVIKIYKKWKES